jgi:hypothetical protein
MSFLNLKIKHIILGVVSIALLSFIGCDDNSYAELVNSTNTDIKIYELTDDGKKILKWTESTRSGEKLDEIGKFSTHINDIDLNKFYLMEVIKKSNNVIKENINEPKENSYTIRAIAKGSDIKDVDNKLNVTIASEMVYQLVKVDLNNNFDSLNFQDKLDKLSNDILSYDIDKSDTIDNRDILQYNSKKHADIFTNLYSDQIEKFNEQILQGQEIILNNQNKMDENKSNDFNLTKIGEYKEIGGIWAVAISNDGTKAYIAHGMKGIKILDISNPKNPTLLGSYPTQKRATNITLSKDGTKAYVSNFYDGLLILDISNPKNPTLLSLTPTKGCTLDTAISQDGTKAYIANGSRGVTILDISDSSKPSKLGELATGGYTSSIKILEDNKTVCIADNKKGLRIIDIANPKVPLILNTFDTDGEAHNLKISQDGTKVFIADGTTGLTIVDVSNTNKITRLGSLDTGDTLSIILSNDEKKAYVGDYYHDFNMIDISNINKPTLLKKLTLESPIWDIQLSKTNEIAYVSDLEKGLKIIDIDDRKKSNKKITPTVIGHLKNNEKVSYNYADARKVVLSNDGTIAYIADGMNGLQIIDISNPNSPTLLSTFNLEYHITYDIALSKDGTKAYIANDFAGLKIIDISNPRRPTLYYTYNTGGYVMRVILSKDETKAYILEKNYGFEIIDISEIANYKITLLGTLHNTRGETQGAITLSNDGTKAYIANGRKGLQIIDISNPRNPTILGSLRNTTYGVGQDITLSKDGTKAYIADKAEGLKIINILNPKNPTLIGSFKSVNFFVLGVTLSKDGTKAYLAVGESGCAVVDISKPFNPSLIGDPINTASFDDESEDLSWQIANSIVMSEDGTKVYLTGKSTWLIIVDLYHKE